LLILAGIAIEFLGRFFGFEGNPTQIILNWAPLGTTALSGILVVVGYFTFIGAKEKLSTLQRRNGIMLILTGALMLASSMIFKSVVSSLFV
jgi:hypothetical protein